MFVLQPILGKELKKKSVDVLCLFVFEGESVSDTDGGPLTVAQQKQLDAVQKEEQFTGKEGEHFTHRFDGEKQFKKVVCVGLGKKTEYSHEAVRRATGSVATLLRAWKSVSVCMVPCVTKAVALNAWAQAGHEGMHLSLYTFRKYKTEELSTPELFFVYCKQTVDSLSVVQGDSRGRLTSEAVCLARDLVNTPAQHMHPEELVRAAQSLVSDTVRVQVFDKKALEEMKAGGLLGIAQGSMHPPALVHLTYTPKKKSAKTQTIALVGKAVTFDSGGLSLKPADSMMGMKMDMAGAADVLGVFSVLERLEIPHVVHGIFGACENMPSGTAIRPGDVVTLLCGKTMEILNTDAEGRVTLADTLHYATEQKPDAIIDLATLTGACMVALGEEITGLMSNHPKFAQTLLGRAVECGELMWELPLEARYKKELKSEVADYKNTTSRYGGALTAGLLLQEFVGKTPWIHLDIAGPSYAERPLNSYTKKGATGHGVRTLIGLLSQTHVV